MGKIKLLIVTVTLLLTCSISNAQNTFFPTKAGTAMVYAYQNAKGSVTNHYRHTIKSVEGSGSNMTISYVMEELDKNRNPLNPPVELPLTVIIKDDIVFLDMKQLLAGQLKDDQLNVEITGVPQELPSNLQPGQSLKDANITMTMRSGPIRVTTTVNITNGKCEAIEEVTVPAGTFKCHKVTQTMTTTAMRIKVVATSVSWYAPGIGTVKSESFDSKSKMTNSMELVSIN